MAEVYSELAPAVGSAYAGTMPKLPPCRPDDSTRGIHIFINSEGGITIGQTLGDFSEIHVSLSAPEAQVLLEKLPAMLAELAADTP